MPDLKFSDEEIAEMVVKAKEQMIQSILSDLDLSIKYSVKDSVTHAIMGQVHEYIEKEIVPALKPALLFQKETLIASMLSMSEEIGKAMAKAVFERVTKNLTSSYHLDKAIKELLE